MRLTHPDGRTVHLAYCTNAHPAGDLDGLVDGLRRVAGPVRARLGWPLLGVGLWLPAPVAARLATDAGEVRRLRAALARERLEVVTLNGFPHRGFHEPVVKTAVYRPDWSEAGRLAYTLDLVRVLHGLLPDDAEGGSISTLPLGWRASWTPARDRRARDRLLRLGAALTRAAAVHGRPVRVGLEPEPGCVVERTAELIDVLADLDTAVIGACLDTAHAAVAFEDPAGALAALAAAGVPVVKAQLSSALRSVGDHRDLAAYAEPRFLHQVRARTAEGTVVGVDDLDEALAGRLPAAAEWRVHFHVPVHDGAPTRTRPELDGALAALAAPGATTTHLEVETYTWPVLPAAAAPDGGDRLVTGLAAELEWVAGRLTAAGLTPLPAAA